LLFTQASPALPALFRRWYFASGSLTKAPFSAPSAPNPESESDKASSMSGFKEPSFADRQKAAMQARQDILNKFRAKPGLDDPEVKRRQVEREAQAAARAKAREAKEAEKAERKRREAEAAAAEAARIAREKEEEAVRQAALEAEQKAKRDARYAARKGKGKKK
jgi:nucleoid-associated protein YgaU